VAPECDWEMIDLKNRSASRFGSGPVGFDNALKCFVGSAITFDWMVLANNHDMKIWSLDRH